MSEETPDTTSSSSAAPRIIAIAGGKGGVGKSVIAANLGLALARRGRRCTLVDLDLGGANLHTLLGMDNPRRSLSDLFRRQVSTLPEVEVDTPFANLGLISGARALLEMANPKHAQKLKVLRQLFRLEVDYVLLDLGAGSHFNVLDFFLSAHEPLLVVAPTPLSVENAYHFLKALYFRKFRQALRQSCRGERLESELRARVARGLRSPRHLMDILEEIAPEARQVVAERMRTLKPGLLLNQVKERGDLELGPKMSSVCHRYFDLDLPFRGAIRNDDLVYRAMQSRQPVCNLYPESSFALSINSMAEQLLSKGAETCRTTD
jgi:flagellar biosynthesis protein FlhG